MRNHASNSGNRHGAPLALRALFWLFAIFSVAETPLGKGDLFAAGGRLIGAPSLELVSGDLPPRYSTAGSKQRSASSIETYRDAAAVQAVESAGGEAAIVQPVFAAAMRFGDVKHAPAAAEVFAAPVRTGYSPRAPPFPA